MGAFAASACEGDPPSVRVNYVEGAVRVYHNLTGRQIQQLSGEDSPYESFEIAGLYRPSVNFKYRYGYTTIRAGGGKPRSIKARAVNANTGNDKIVNTRGGDAAGPHNVLCVLPDRIDLEISIKPSIYLGVEFRRGSCFYEAIRKHEFQHLQFDDQVIRSHVRRIQERLTVAMTRKNGFASRDELERTLAALVDESMESMHADRRRMHQTIDNEQSYDEVSSRCQQFARRRQISQP